MANRAEEDKIFLEAYDTTRRTLYVTDLPPDTDETEITRYFSEFGKLGDVKMVKPDRGKCLIV